MLVEQLLDVRKKKGKKAESNESEGTVTAPIPGMVVEYKVKKGDEVKVGDALVVVEAMKMMNSLESKVNGIVTEIKLESGDSVGKGDVLLVIEPKK